MSTGVLSRRSQCQAVGNIPFSAKHHAFCCHFICSGLRLKSSVFFSDYQGLHREFPLLNRNAGVLLKIDRDADPSGFREQLESLLAGKMNVAEKEVFTELMGQDNP